ncbi:hypothetical protein GS4_11_00740 [Gordonia soli NBRC 108243]|uniref:CHK kinase-like domain-containing protein n=1 Tax=Gordonia soli NBRC 108243 TaxID=1223545 RepID=M0QGQ3_9ACTN|nr:hypothetical protein GS4_11_00740 [Gordonia soli NBRC 108243]
MEVTAVHATPVGSGQMAGSFRLDLTYADAVTGGMPSTVIAKLATGPAEQREFGAGAFRNEVQFYADLAPTVRVPTPRCHASTISPSGAEFVLLLDDLAPAVQGDQITGCTPEQASAVAVAAAGLHAPRWDDDSLLDTEIGFALPTDDDRVLMESVLEPMADIFRARFDLTASESATVDWLVANAGTWLVAPQRHFTLIHGDLRIDNVMFGPDGAVTVIDWQTIVPGQPLRDIAFLLSTSLTVADRRANEDAILADYHRALVGHGISGYTMQECREDYVSALLQAPLIIVFGCAAAQPTERGDRMFRVMLDRATAAIGDLVPDALG